MNLVLESQVETAINDNPYLAGRKLRFETTEGKVVLSGVVDTYFQKQMAQEALRRVQGVQQIDNRLEVHWV